LPADFCTDTHRMTPTIIAEPATTVDPDGIATPELDLIPVDNSVGETVSELGGELRALAHRSSHYLVGLVANLALGFVSFPIFTRVFSVDQYGMMDLGQRLLLLMTVMSKLGIQNASLRFYNSVEFAKDPAAEKKYYSTLFYGILGSSAITVLLFLVAGFFFPQLLSGGPLASLSYILLGVAVVRAVSSILQGFLRVEERTKAFNFLLVATKAGTIAGVCALFVLMSRTARTYFVGTLLVEGLLAAGVTVWFFRRRVLSPTAFRWDLFRSAVAYGTPLVVYEFAFAILGSSDRFLVRHYVGAEALGFYAVAHGLARNVNELFVVPLGLALVPMYMRIWTTDGARKTTAFLSTAFDLYIIASAGLLAAVAACGRSMVILLASSKYTGADRLIPIILAALFIYAAHVFVGAGLLIHKKTLQMAVILACAAIFNIALNCFLLPRIGLMGGAISTLASYLACIIALAVASHRVLPLNVHKSSLAKYAVAAAMSWFLGSQLRIASPFLECLVRFSFSMIVYVGILYLLDERVRGVWQWFTTWLKQRRQPAQI
jgi:O-antigen/teichoic acid export membrane protein